MGFQNKIHAAAVAALLGAALSSSVANAQAVIKGFLYDDASGARVVGGTVMMVDPSTDGPVVHVAVNTAGEFVLRGPAGRYQIAAVHAGYTSVLSAPMTFENGESLTIRVPMATNGDPTHNIGVLEHTKSAVEPKRSAAASPSYEWMRGFEQRRMEGTGISYDRRQLAQANANTVADLLRRVPGVAMGSDDGTSSVAMSRTAMFSSMSSVIGGTPCRVGWFVDGRRIDKPGVSDPVTEGLSSIPLNQLEAVEVFRGLSEMPAEFAYPDLQCGAVALWMRR